MNSFNNKFTFSHKQSSCFSYCSENFTYLVSSQNLQRAIMFLLEFLLLATFLTFEFLTCRTWSFLSATFLVAYYSLLLNLCARIGYVGFYAFHLTRRINYYYNHHSAYIGRKLKKLEANRVFLLKFGPQVMYCVHPNSYILTPIIDKIHQHLI